MKKPRRGDRVEVCISELDEKGQGVGMLEGYTARVRGALPGDMVRAVVGQIRHRSQQLDARKTEVLKVGVQRIPARCVHFGICGGCVWQDVPYDQQVRMKQRILQHCLIAAGIDVNQDVPLVMEQPFNYRNKMEFSFGTSKEGLLELGLHLPGRFDRVFDLDACHLQSDISNRLVSHIRAFVRTHRLSVYHLKDHQGLLRFLTIREGKRTGEVMVILTTSEDAFHLADRLSEDIQMAFPEVSCVVHSVNRRKAQVATGDEENALLGQGHIREKLGDFVFEISPRSFFQTNTLQSERLYRRVVELADISGGDRVLDVYCGTGGISLFLAEHALQVVGIEVVEDAVQDAVRNCAINGIGNCVFMAGQAELLLEQLRQQGDFFDVAVIDPPRAGVHGKALSALSALRPSRIVYVSCNPQALGSDLSALERAGYRTDYIQLVDMFPHTPHCETLAKLVLQQ